MNCKIVKLLNFSGTKTTVYSVFIDDEQKTLFDKFIQENLIHKNELKSVISRLKTISTKTGAQEHFFKQKEGSFGDGIEALYDLPSSNLRLYCIRYGTSLIILGGGGIKPKNIRALQENDKLKYENYLLRKIAKIVNQRIKDRDIKFANDYMNFEGELEFTINE